MVYFMPRLEINPNVPHNKITDKIKETKGMIKYTINFDELVMKSYIYKNDYFVTFIKSKNFIPLPNFYSKEVSEIFDIYGGIYEVNIDEIVYKISLYFYKLKNPELITRNIIQNKDFNLIFQQTYLIENNILDMDYHSYRLSLFFQELSNPKFLNLSYENNELCKTKLYRYQRHNIYRLLHFHNVGINVRFNNNLIKYFDNGLIYDFTSTKFIEESDIMMHTINGGIVMDEPGTGKTLQFIIYLLEIIMLNTVLNNENEEKALILVPDEDIKKHWIEEFKKHIVIPLEELPIILKTSSEFQKINLYNKNDIKYIEKIKIIICDEIHTLWTKFSDVFDKLLKFKIKYRWGLSATPFITPNSLMNIIRFLIGTNFHNERIANIPRVQDEIMKVFLKNTKFNTKDEYLWAELTINDVKLKFDKIQQDLYDTEAKTTNGTYNLRLLACQMELMFNKDVTQSITPKELKMFANTHYKSIYETELVKLKELIYCLENIHKNKDKFEPMEYIQRFNMYEGLIKKKESQVMILKSAYDYHTSCINKIDKVITDPNTEDDIDPDEKCAICLCPHESPIIYFKNCGHYFCKSCIDEVFAKSIYGFSEHSQIQCPMCRKNIKQEDILIVKDKCDITASAKCRTLIELISKTTDRFIIFTQFPKLIENLIIVLQRHNIIAVKFSIYKHMEQKDAKVIILSSDENAAGINLTEFNNVIIFEPFEDSMYCKEIEKQLIGRVHRINQTKSVNVYRLIMLNTIEEQIYSKFI